MAKLAAVVYALMCASGVWAGVWAAGRGKWSGIAVAAAGLALVVARGVVFIAPGIEERLYEYALYPYFQSTPAVLGAVALLAYLGRKAPTRMLRALLWVLMCAMVVQEGYQSARFVLAERWYGRLTGEVDSTGLCPQTSMHTCGAAAAAMLLDSAGVKTNEREMARECLVRSGVGVTDLTLLRGVRRKLKGTPWRVKVMRGLTYGELMRLRKPCLVSLRQSWLLDHTVIVDWMNERFVTMLDPEPKVGRETISRGSFERSWRGDAMVLERADGATGPEGAGAPRVERTIEF